MKMAKHRKQYFREYFQRKEVKERRRAYQRMHPRRGRYPKAKERVRLWRKRNKHRILAYARRRRLDPVVRILDAIRSRVHRALTRDKAWKSGKTLQMLGCSVEELKKHLESKFMPGMNWENWGRYGWHIDHVRPLAFFNLADFDEQATAMHYTNLQPLWAIDNLSKGKKA